MEEFIHYMEECYINDERIPLWNVSNLTDHRTNNDLEGIHSRLNKNLPKRPNTNFWFFVNGIRKEQHIEDQYLVQFNRGLRLPFRKLKYRNRELNIELAKTNLANNVINVAQFLHEMSNLY